MEPEGVQQELQQEPWRGQVCLTLGGLRGFYRWTDRWGSWRLGPFVQVNLVL